MIISINRGSRKTHIERVGILLTHFMQTNNGTNELSACIKKMSAEAMNLSKGSVDQKQAHELFKQFMTVPNTNVVNNTDKLWNELNAYTASLPVRTSIQTRGEMAIEKLASYNPEIIKSDSTIKKILRFILDVNMKEN